MNQRKHACPNCRIELQTSPSPEGVHFCCDQCRGKLIGVGLLRNVRSPESVQALWMKAKAENRRVGKACPACAQPMLAVNAPSDLGSVELDVCPVCFMIWFDGSELDRIPKRPAKDILREREKNEEKERKQRREYMRETARIESRNSLRIGRAPVEHSPSAFLLELLSWLPWI